MSEKLGPMTFGKKDELVFLGKEIGEQRDYGEIVAQQIDEEVHDLVREAHERATDVLTQHREQLERIADKLVEIETLGADDFVALFDGTYKKKPNAPDSPRSPEGSQIREERPASDHAQTPLDMPTAPAPA